MVDVDSMTRTILQQRLGALDGAKLAVLVDLRLAGMQSVACLPAGAPARFS
jgi:hypothetical protein